MGYKFRGFSDKNQTKTWLSWILGNLIFYMSEKCGVWGGTARYGNKRVLGTHKHRIFRTGGIFHWTKKGPSIRKKFPAVVHVHYFVKLVQMHGKRHGFYAIKGTDTWNMLAFITKEGVFITRENNQEFRLFGAIYTTARARNIQTTFPPSGTWA